FDLTPAPTPTPTATATATATPTATPTCYPAPGNMTLWHKAEGKTDDSSGNGNSGTLQGGMGYAPGMVGQAYSFDGIDDYVSVASNATIDPTTTASVDAWVNFTQTPSAAGRYMAITSKATGSPGGDFDLLASPTDNKFYFYAGNGFNVASTTVIQTGTW